MLLNELIGYEKHSRSDLSQQRAAWEFQDVLGNESVMATNYES